MKKELTKKQIVMTSIVWGIIIASFLLILSIVIPPVGIPLLVVFIIIWTIATLMRLGGIKNLHIFGDKFIEKD